MNLPIPAIRVSPLRSFSAMPPRKQPDFTPKSAVEARDWCGVVLSISRRSLAADLRVAGVADDPQLLNPWHELPIVTGEGTLFDLAAPQRQASDQWRERQQVALTRGAARHRGHALRLMFQALIDLGDKAQKKLERWVTVFAESLPVKLRQRLPESTVREFGVLYATGRLAIAAGILNWRRQRILRALIRSLRATDAGHRPPSIKRQIKDFLDERLLELELPWKPFNGELDRFPTQGYRTHGNNCENWWINAEYFRSWFSDRQAEVEMALRLLFESGHLIPASHFVDFPGAPYVEHPLKWNSRARKKTGFYKLAVSRN